MGSSALLLLPGSLSLITPHFGKIFWRGLGEHMEMIGAVAPAAFVPELQCETT